MSELQFSDPDNWLEMVKVEVADSYLFPKNMSNKVCVDLGCNVGAFPLLYHKKFKNIYCFDAGKYCSKTAQKNVEKENIKNVKVYNYAVSAKSGEIVKLRQFRGSKDGEIVKGGEISGNCSIAILPRDIKGDGYDYENEYEEVETISLEDIFKLINHDRINYLKCDVECAEYDLFMNKDLSNIDFLAMELHCNLGLERLTELVNYLEKYFDYHKGLKPEKLPDTSKGEFYHLVLNLTNKNSKSWKLF